MTNASFCLMRCTVTKNNYDIPPWACLGTYPFHLGMSGHVKPPPINQTLSRHNVIYQHFTSNSDKSLLRKRYLATLKRE